MKRADVTSPFLARHLLSLEEQIAVARQRRRSLLRAGELIESLENATAISGELNVTYSLTESPSKPIIRGSFSGRDPTFLFYCRAISIALNCEPQFTHWPDGKMRFRASNPLSPLPTFDLQFTPADLT